MRECRTDATALEREATGCGAGGGPPIYPRRGRENLATNTQHTESVSTAGGRPIMGERRGSCPKVRASAFPESPVTEMLPSTALLRARGHAYVDISLSGKFWNEGSEEQEFLCEELASRGWFGTMSSSDYTGVA